MDFQVKINGYRVELGEVEQCALAFGAIKSCCAVVLSEAHRQRSGAVLRQRGAAG